MATKASVITSAAIKAFRKRRRAKAKGTYLGFSRLSAALKGKVRNPGAVAAMIGMKKYGRQGLQAMAAAGRK